MQTRSEKGASTETKTFASDVPSVASLAVLVLGRDTPHVVRLPSATWVDLGRDASAFIALDDDQVSRSQLRLRVDSGEVLVEDLASKNGSFLDGIRLGRHVPTVWSRGATLFVGGTTLVLVRAPALVGDTTRTISGPVETADHRWDAVLERIAMHDVPVLILGETGVGKEVTAERIHRASPRRDRPLIKVHASAIVASLFESELFGHERGAFTGATHARAGLVEQASGGTLFLDEIGELPLEAQVKLLRVLDDRRVRRVGSDRDHAVDFRLVTATHRCLEDEVRDGKFRKDLFFRIAPIAIRVPPLRDRLHELPELVNALLSQLTGAARRPMVALDDGFTRALLEYDWPGNVRELRGVLEHALVVGDGRLLRASDLPGLELARRRASMRAAPMRASFVPPSVELDSTDPLSAAAEIERALALNGGNQKRAAQTLGISRRTLLYRLDRLGIARPRKPKARSSQV